MSSPSYICVLFSLNYTLKYSKPLESHIFNIKRFPQLLKKSCIYILYLCSSLLFLTTYLLQSGCQLYCPTELFWLCVLVITMPLKPLGNFHPHFTPLLSSNWTSLPSFKGTWICSFIHLFSRMESGDTRVSNTRCGSCYHRVRYTLYSFTLYKSFRSITTVLHVAFI